MFAADWLFLDYASLTYLLEGLPAPRSTTGSWWHVVMIQLPWLPVPFSL